MYEPPLVARRGGRFFRFTSRSRQPSCALRQNQPGDHHQRHGDPHPGDWFSFNTKLKGWSVTGGSFATFGLAEIAPGFVSLDFSGNQQGGRATSRIRIPLN